MKTKIIKKKLKANIEKESTEMENVNKISKNLYYSGFCLTDIYNFAEFNVKEKPITSDDIQIRKFEFKEDQLFYTLGAKITKINTIEKNNVYFDRIKNKQIDKIFVDYFRKKFPKGEFYWITNFNRKEKNYEMVGIVLFDELQGLLKLKKNEKIKGEE